MPCRLSCSAVLEQAADSQLLQLYGNSSRAPEFAYVAAHLRLGGLGHEGHLAQDRGTGRGPLADLITALRCAEYLGDGVYSAKVPVLTITDNHMLRGFIMSGALVSTAVDSLHNVQPEPARAPGERRYSFGGTPVYLKAVSSC